MGSTHQVASVDHHSESVFGHKPGLFLLFFTEMWERFSYYGMRALLVLFLVSEAAGGGWAWSRADALNLYAIYTGMVYLTPILGGIAADKLLGYRGAVLLGALLMTLGHAAMAVEQELSFYLGLALLVAGNGFFKPNISSIVGQLYADSEAKKDAAYTIFYMGINAGAFLGILLCGYIGEKVGWSYGFGLAGIFMGLGMVMFYLGQSILGVSGDRDGASETVSQSEAVESETAPGVVRDRLMVIAVLSFSTIFFWMAFEQAGGSMTIFAKDYTQRVLTGSAASVFFWINTALTVIPLALVTYVLLRFFGTTYSRIPYSNLSIGLSFVIIWIMAIWMLNKEFNMRAYEIQFASPQSEAGELVTTTVRWDKPLDDNDEILVVDLEGRQGQGKLKIIAMEAAENYETEFSATVVRERENETEVPASWFGILNSFFIVALAPLFSRLWESRLNPSAPVKFGLGLILLGMGFGALAMGSWGIEQGASRAEVSLWWLVIAYLFHTVGELCVSPVGLSYVSKLAPVRLVGLMFGIWFGATAIANYLAGWSGSLIDQISDQYGLAIFFLIYTLIPVLAGVGMWLLTGWIKKKMHGIQ
ncbi:MAG: MFS transporter [Planctomycetaceae bacterium]|nr:MFS transporter [Planctomycetaceae bacterium]